MVQRRATLSSIFRTLITQYIKSSMVIQVTLNLHIAKEKKIVQRKIQKKNMRLLTPVTPE